MPSWFISVPWRLGYSFCFSLISALIFHLKFINEYAFVVSKTADLLGFIIVLPLHFILVSKPLGQGKLDV